MAGTLEVRRLAVTDPSAAGDVAHATGDVLAVTARAVEGRRGGPMTQAADAYDRAARDLHDRTPRPRPAGDGLRAAARALALAGRAGRDDTTQVWALLSALTALTGAVAALRDAQSRTAQAAAARDTAHQLRAVAPETGTAAGPPAPPRPSPTPSSRSLTHRSGKATMTQPLHERTYDSPDADAAARLAQMVTMTATLAEAVARLQANRTADRADTDERAAAAARAQRITEHAAARVAWSPAQQDDWLYRATTPDLVRAWSAATTWAPSDPDATHTAARLENRLRQLQPAAMTAYDQARTAGAEPAPAMHAAAQHFTYPLPPTNRTTADASNVRPRPPQEVAADAYPFPTRDGVTAAARARVHLITTATTAATLPTPTPTPTPMRSASAATPSADRAAARR